jgi:hypothetical protein
MPTLDWIGKKAVVNHHRTVPFRLLKAHADLSAGNVLTNATLALLPQHPAGPDHPRIVFGEACRLSLARLTRENITFKQLPYEIKVT